MEDEYQIIYRWKDGKLRPMKFKRVSTNDFMNNLLRNENKAEVVEDIQTNTDEEYKGHLEIQKEDEWDYEKHQELKKHETYYQLENGEKIEFIDKKEYKKMVDDFYDSLTQEEKEAIDSWVSDPINYNKTMDKVFEKKGVTLKNDTLLFRRASDDYLDLEKGVNREFAMSTSANDVIPKTLPSGIPFGDKEMYIIAPKGTKVLPIEKVAVEMTHDKGEKLIYARQHEIVLPKGTSYEIIEDRSTYYYRPAKANEVSDVPITEQQYVVKLTNKKYNKADYEKPEYRFQWSHNGYENYIYKYKGRDIEIKEKYNDGVTGWNGLERRKKKTRKDVVKYQVSEMLFYGQPEYYDSYDEAIRAIKKYIK